MSLPRIVAWVLSIGVVAACVDPVSSQDFPIKPIRILAAEPGGGSDFAARLIAQGMAGNLGQPVIVDNRGGSSGVIAAMTVAKATPDGYTLLFYGNGFWLLPFLQSKVPYDPIRDFLPVTLALTTPLILSIHPSVAAKSVQELIVLAKAKPGELNYGSGGSGTIPHLAAELFNVMAGVNMVSIPYKGTGPTLNALLGNEVQLMFANASAVTPHVKSGRLTALAVTSAHPYTLLPSLPTVADSGLPGYESETMYGMFAPAGTSSTIIRRLNREIVRTLNSAVSKEKFVSAGAEIVGSSPEHFAGTVKSDMARLGKVIKDAGIRGD